MGKGRMLWRAIGYVTNGCLLHSYIGEYESGSEFWEEYRSGYNRKYSYKWCVEFAKSGKDWWNDLFMKDPYLKECCEYKKVSALDQLLYYSEEYWHRKY